MGRSIPIVGFAALIAAAGFAQSPGAEPRFEVASVKVARPDAPPGSMDGGPLPVGPFNRADHNPERISRSNVRLIRVIQVAYDFPADRISSLRCGSIVRRSRFPAMLSKWRAAD
jgi:hypothetical protein